MLYNLYPMNMISEYYLDLVIKYIRALGNYLVIFPNSIFFYRSNKVQVVHEFQSSKLSTLHSVTYHNTIPDLTPQLYGIVNSFGARDFHLSLHVFHILQFFFPFFFFFFFFGNTSGIWYNVKYRLRRIEPQIQFLFLI